MYRKRERKIADAIETHSSRDRIFSYVVLFVISLVSVIIGYILWGLITALTTHTEKIVQNMDSLAVDVKSMSKDVHAMSVYISHMESMDSSMSSMGNDINKMANDISTMTTTIEHMQENTKSMKGDMKDFNKLNPMKLF